MRAVAVPFIQDTFLPLFICIAGAAAIGLGLRQTLGESIGGTYPFLLHRPARRRWLIGMKLLVGLVGYLICAAIPVVAYGLWTATPGTHASPFQWSMTVPSWICWFAMTVLYLGAFLTGLRPGGWYKSRLLPLPAAGLAVVLATFLALEPGRPLWAVLAIIVADMLFLIAILFVAQMRDYL